MTTTNTTVDRTLFYQRAIILLCMYLCYAGFMLIKTSVVAGAPALLADPSLGLTNADWASVLAFGTMGGIVGKFLSGWSADRWGGKKIFTTGLFFSSLGLAYFSRQSQFFAFSFTYCCILLCNSSGWPSMTKLIGGWFEPHQFGRVWGLISTSSRVGTITATFVVSALLRHMEWRQMLLITASVGAGLFLLAFLFMKERARAITPLSVDATKSMDTAHPFEQLSLKQAFWEFLRNSRFQLICVSMMGLTILWDFLNFVPLFLKESLALTVADAALATSSFPIGSLVSVLLGGFIFDKLTPRNVAKIIGVYLLIAVLCLVTLLALPQMTMNSQQKVACTLVALFIFGFTVSPAYYLPMSIFSIRFGGPHSGFLVALLDACGYAASVLFSFGAGHTLKNTGSWTAFLGLLIGVALLSMVFTFRFLHGEAKLR